MIRHRVGLLLCLAGLAGCASRPTGPYETTSVASRDTREADRLNEQASRIMNGWADRTPAGDELKKAEDLLRAALTADLFHGAAHNNLGIAHLMQGRLYESASEFETARKLLPGHPDPRVNLALVMERAGRVEEALAAYGSALEVYPDHLASLQGLARLQIRAGKRDERTTHALQEIAMRGEEPWRLWARAELEMHGR